MASETQDTSTVSRAAAWLLACARDDRAIGFIFKQCKRGAGRSRSDKFES